MATKKCCPGCGCGGQAGARVDTKRSSCAARPRRSVLGDLYMRPWSADPRWIPSFDDFPLTSVEVKASLFREAAEESWTMVLSHEPRKPVGRLVVDRDRFRFEAIVWASAWARRGRSASGHSVHGRRGGPSQFGLLLRRPLGFLVGQRGHGHTLPAPTLSRHLSSAGQMSRRSSVDGAWSACAPALSARTGGVQYVRWFGNCPIWRRPRYLTQESLDVARRLLSTSLARI